MGVEVNDKNSTFIAAATGGRTSFAEATTDDKKLRFHYLVSHAKELMLIGFSVWVLLLTVAMKEFFPVCCYQLIMMMRLNLVTVTSVMCCGVMVLLGIVYLFKRPRKVYLVDFACYKPGPDLMCCEEHFMEASRSVGSFSDESLAFQRKILERSGTGQKTYFPESIMKIPANLCMAEARKEVETFVFGSIDQVLKKTRVKAKEIAILVVNCSLFGPAPSLSAMIVNHYKLRGNVRSYNLGGMGCSAGLISIDLANNLLQVMYPINLHSTIHFFLFSFSFSLLLNYTDLNNRCIPTRMLWW